jgi:hypothetical protein
MSSTVPEIGHTWGSGAIATGYSAPRRGGHRLETEPFEARGMVPALGFASTVEDLIEFARWQFRVLAGDDDGVLSETTLREMYRVHQIDDGWEAPMGLGFILIRDRGRRFVGHAGFCAGFQSNFALQPEDRIAAIAISNSMIPIWTYTSVAYDLFAPAIRAERDDPGGGNATPEQFERFVGSYDLFPWSGEYGVVPWNGGLAALRLPAADPRAALRPLTYVGETRFQALDEGGWPIGEFVFEVDEGGDVVGVVADGTLLPRIR